MKGKIKYLLGIMLSIMLVIAMQVISPVNVKAVTMGTTDDGYEYELSSDGTTASITGYSGSKTALVIPETIEGATVTAISGNAFEGDNIISVESNTVKSIGYGAFF
ncbi:MAG: hypothetical protein K6E13_02955 [Lachnospiraceae bacterium]|nr:hypothetical protein [Lachnospiraceae bacterium]